MPGRSTFMVFATIAALLLHATATAGEITAIKAGSLFDSKSGHRLQE